MTNNFEPPKEDIPEQAQPVNCQVIGIKEKTNKRELLYETTDYKKFLEAYSYYYKSGKYVIVLKEYNNKPGGIK